jgi:hypothetical protein
MSKPGAGKELVDDLKEKWAKLNPFAKRAKTWGGEGHKLGSASAPQVCCTLPPLQHPPRARLTMR